MAVAVESCASETQILEISKYFTNLRKRRDNVEGTELFDRCTQLLESHQPADAVLALIEALPILFSEALDREVEGCMNVIFSLAVKLSGSQIDLASALRDAVSAKPAEKPLLRLQILSRMFNSHPPQSPARLVILQTMLRFASDAGMPGVITQSFSQLDTWLNDWSATPKQRRELYETAAGVLKSAGKDDELYAILHKYLATFETAADEELPASAPFATRAIALAIGMPEVFQMGELLSLRAVARLSGTPASELLSVFTRGCLADYRAFVAKNAGALEALGVDPAAAERKIRLLTLVSTCAAAPGGDVRISALSKDIDVAESETERWVVEAITTGLLSAKIDQQSRSVRVSYTQHRLFEAAQWGMLEQKLTAWRQVVGGVLSVLQQNSLRQREGKPLNLRGAK